MAFGASDSTKLLGGPKTPTKQSQWSKEDPKPAKIAGDFTQDSNANAFPSIKKAAGVSRRRKYSPQKSTINKSVVK